MSALRRSLGILMSELVEVVVLYAVVVVLDDMDCGTYSAIMLSIHDGIFDSGLCRATIYPVAGRKMQILFFNERWQIIAMRRKAV